MAIWNRNKVPPANLNAGQQYNAEDWTSEQTFNAANNNAFYAVDYAEALGDTPDTSQVGNIGTPTVTLIDNVKTIDGTPKTFKKFKFANLKGEPSDMMKSVYDPDSKEADAFDSTNHKYNNSTSGLTATKTQAAIDEIAGAVDGLDSSQVAHLSAPLPHKMLVDGVAYNYGFSQTDGFVKFLYEEVE